MKSKKQLAEAQRITQMIVSLRKERGWTPQQFADALGINIQSVYRIESGFFMPSKKVLTHIAEYFNLTFDTFAPDYSRHPRESNTTPRNSFGKALRDARVKRGWTQKELAEAMKIAVQSIVQYETGSYVPVRRKNLEEKLKSIFTNEEAQTIIIELNNLPKTRNKKQREITRVILPNGKLRCGNCRQEKELDEFHGDTNSKTGRHGWCKVCREEKRQAKKVRWTHMVADGILRGEKAQVIEPPKQHAYKPQPDDYPDPVWVQFEHLPPQWFPAPRLLPLVS